MSEEEERPGNEKVMKLTKGQKDGLVISQSVSQSVS